MNPLNDFDSFKSLFHSLPGTKLESTIATVGIVCVSMLHKGEVSEDVYHTYKDLIGAIIAAAKEDSKNGPLEPDFNRISSIADTLIAIIQAAKQEAAQ